MKELKKEDMALFIACASGNITAAKTALEAGANVECILSVSDEEKEAALTKNPLISEEMQLVVSDGFSPIHFAARRGDLDLFKLLAENNANLHKVIEFSKNKLMLDKNCVHLVICFCPPQRQLELLSFLLKRGANVNHQDADGNTPLHYWILTSGNNEIEAKKVLKLMLEHYVNLYIKNEDGLTVKEFDGQQGSQRFQKMLNELRQPSAESLTKSMPILSTELSKSPNSNNPDSSKRVFNL